MNIWHGLRISNITIIQNSVRMYVKGRREGRVKWENEPEELEVAISTKTGWVLNCFFTAWRRSKPGKPRWSLDLTSEIPFHHIEVTRPSFIVHKYFLPFPILFSIACVYNPHSMFIRSAYYLDRIEWVFLRDLSFACEKRKIAGYNSGVCDC
jgi:hypothetical protein